MNRDKVIKMLHLLETFDIYELEQDTCVCTDKEWSEFATICLDALQCQQEYQYQRAKDFSDTVDACQCGVAKQIDECIDDILKESGYIPQRDYHSTSLVVEDDVIPIDDTDRLVLTDTVIYLIKNHINVNVERLD